MEIIKNTPVESRLLSDVRQLIESTKSQVAVTVNSAMTLMYWYIGDRINRELLGGERAAYGKQVVASLSRELIQQYGGREFSEKNLNRMRLFATRFPNLEIWTPVVSKLSWSHFLQVMPIEDDLADGDFRVGDYFDHIKHYIMLCSISTLQT